MKITDIKALQILDSRGNPTVRTFIKLEDGSSHASSVPSGASTGTHEAVELRDNDDKKYNGKGVLKAVENVNTKIKTAVVGMEADPNVVDDRLLELDGTDNKSNLGANAILSVSQAVCRAAAHAENIPLWKYMFKTYFRHPELSGHSERSEESNNKGPNKIPDQVRNDKKSTPSFPQLMVNIVNGGRHANWNFDIQEFMIVPNSNIPPESVKIASEIFHALGEILKQKGLSTLVGDEGGYSPKLNSNEEVFDLILEAGIKAGYENLKDFRISIDAASSEFFKEDNYTLNAKKLNAEELTAYYAEIGQKYFILSFEDAFAEDDWEAHINFADMAEKFQFITIGDDLFCTNPKRIKRGIDEKAANAVLIKPNQIGTMKETVDAINMTHKAGWKTAISHRSGDTEDSFIADLAYACGSEFIKTGSMSRSERLSKYNRLLEIEAGL